MYCLESLRVYGVDLYLKETLLHFMILIINSRAGDISFLFVVSIIHIQWISLILFLRFFIVQLKFKKKKKKN